MKTLLYNSICIFILTCSSLYSQNLEPIWIKNYGGTENDWFGKDCIQIDNEGNIIIAGYLKGVFIDTFYVNGSFVAKFSQNGNLIWLSKPDSSLDFKPQFLRTTTNNDIYIFSHSMPHGTWGLKNKLAKINYSGNIQWCKEYITAQPDFGTDPNQYIALDIKNEELYLALNLYSYIVLPNNDTIRQSGFHRKYYVLELDSSGQLTDFFRSLETTVLINFKTDQSGNFYHYTTAPSPYTKRLIKYDNDYTLMLHVKDFSLDYDAIHISNDNNIYTSILGNDTLFTVNQNDSITSNNLHLIKMNSDFEIEWTHKFKGFKECPHPVIPQLNMCNSNFSEIKSTTDNNNVFVYGLFKYKFRLGNNLFYTSDSSKYSFFISKFSKEGIYYWTEVLNSKETLSNNEVNTIEVNVLPDGSLLCGLMYESEVQIGDSLYSSNGNYDLIFMRLQETGVGLKPTQENKNSYFELYPNPVNDVFEVNFSTTENFQSGKINIYNFCGALVYEIPIKLDKSNNKIKINAALFAPGMYYICVETQQQRWTRKFVKL